MKLLAPLTLIALACSAAPAFAQDHTCTTRTVPGHYEWREQEVAGPGGWVWETRTVEVPGRWEVTQQTRTEPGHWEVRTRRVQVSSGVHVSAGRRGVRVGVDLGPVHLDLGRSRHRSRHHPRVRVQPRFEVRTERVWVPGRTTTIPVRRWIPPTTRTERVRTYRQSTPHAQQVRVWIPARTVSCCAPRSEWPRTRDWEQRRHRVEAGAGRVRVHVPVPGPVVTPRTTRTVRNLLD